MNKFVDTIDFVSRNTWYSTENNTKVSIKDNESLFHTLRNRQYNKKGMLLRSKFNPFTSIRTIKGGYKNHYGNTKIDVPRSPGRRVCQILIYIKNHDFIGES